MRLLCLLALLGCHPSGTLYFAGREPGTLIRVDAASETVSVQSGVREMGGGDAPYMLHFTGGRLVTFALGRSHSFAPDLAAPQSLGESWFYVPSATPGRVWNILRTPRSNVTFRGVREVAVDGRVTFTRRWRVPGWAVGAVDDGLVLSGRRLEVWDPASRKLVRRLPGGWPVAFRGSLAVSCSDPCDTLYLNDRPVRGEFGLPQHGAFSPDGRWLALPAAGQRIGLVDVAAGTATTIPGARIDADYPVLAWASSGWLFWNTGGGQVAAWRAGEPRQRLLGVNVGRVIDMTSD